MESASLVRMLPVATGFRSSTKSNDKLNDKDVLGTEQNNNLEDEDSLLNDDIETYGYRTENNVTADEVRFSLIENEDTDSLSLSDDSETIDINGLSLDALRARRNELINSMRNNLDTSSLSNVDDDFNDGNISTSTVINNEFGQNEEFKDAAEPPAAKFLKEWKGDSSLSVAEKRLTSELEYEEMYSSLNEILKQPDDTILDQYSSKLDEYTAEVQKRFDGFLSQIDTEKRSVLSADKYISKQLDEIIELSDTTLVDDTIAEKTLVEDIKIEPVSEPGLEVKKEIKVESVSETEPVIKVEPVIETEPIIKTELVIKTESVARTESNIDGPAPSSLALTAIVDDKDPENLIIEDEDVAAVENLDEVEDILLASDNEDEQVIPKPSATPQNELKEFISNDEAENRDNQDPQWDYLRNLSNDYERYLAVRARWKNLEIPNPKKDLTCLCQRVKNGKVPPNYMQSVRNKNGKRPHSPNNYTYKRNSKRPRRESCTMLFDRSISQLVKDVERERFLIEREQEERLSHLAEIQQLEQRLAFRNHRDEMYLMDMRRRHFMETENLIKTHRARLDQLMQRSRQKIGALRAAADEVREFHEFYPDQEARDGEQNSLVYLTDIEVQEILEVEDMLMRFETFYKVPPAR